MKQLPDEQTLKELLSMGKDLEEQARLVYQMSEALAQKYDPKSSEKPQSPPQQTTIQEK